MHKRLKNLSFPLLISLMTLAPLCSSAQIASGYLITTKGEKRVFYRSEETGDGAWGDVSVSAQYIYYYNNDGKKKMFPQKKIEECSYGSHKFQVLPIYNLGMKRLHRVIAENDRYMMTLYYHTFNYLFIFDKTDMEAVVRKRKMGTTKKSDRNILEQHIQPYFEDCPVLIESIDNAITNIQYGSFISSDPRKLFENVFFYDCR